MTVLILSCLSPILFSGFYKKRKYQVPPALGLLLLLWSFPLKSSAYTRGYPGHSAHETTSSTAFSSRRVTVAQDGSGDYQRLQAAIDANPSDSLHRLTILLKPGRYHEKIRLDSSHTYLSLIGTDAEKTIIVFDDHSGKPRRGGGLHTTRSSYTFLAGANDFFASNVSFDNSAGYSAGQAVAMEIIGDRCVFSQCRFLGNQDVLFIAAPTSRCYFDDCYIEGTTDFIFGAGTAWFDDCRIFSKKNSPITAASTPASHPYGFVFHDCRLTAEPGLVRVVLGRPWRDYAAVCFIRCDLGPQINAAGWSNWKGTRRDQTARFSEYKNKGAGAGTTGRVKWSRQLSRRESARYRLTQVLRGWKPVITQKAE